MIDTSEVSTLLEGTFWREAKSAPDLGMEVDFTSIPLMNVPDDYLTLEEVRYLLGDC